MSKVYVKDIQDKQHVEAIFKVGKKALPTGKNGKPFLTLSLFDKTGEIDARVWDNAAELDKAFEAGDLLKVAAETVVHQGHLQLKIDKLEKAELGELSAEEFAAPPAKEEAREGGFGAAERRFQEMIGLIDRVQDGHVRALLRSFTDDPELAPLIKRAPAAKSIHHAYPGGLVEHTLSCMKLAHRLCDHYPMADRDLVVAGAFLHDVGKTKELSFDKGTEYTDEGRLVGHLVMTCQWIHERAARIEGFPALLEQHLTHLVLSHHGSLEYGSPKVPATLEALLVHELDEIDSRVNSWLGIMQRDPGDRWTDFNKLYDRHLWKGPTPTAGGRRPVEGRSGGKKRHKVPPAQAGGEAAPAERPQGEARPPREPRPPRPERAERPERGDRPPRPAKPAEKPAAALTFKPFAAISPSAEPEPEPTTEGSAPSAAAPAEEKPQQS